MAKIKKVIVDGVEYELGGSGSGGGFKKITINYEALQESPFLEYGEDFTVDDAKAMEDGDLVALCLTMNGMTMPSLSQISKNEEMLGMISESMIPGLGLDFTPTPICFATVISSSSISGFIVLCEEGIAFFS